MATYRMCEPPLARELSMRRRLGLMAGGLAALAVTVACFAPDLWKPAAAAPGGVGLILATAYFQSLKFRRRRAYILDGAGVRRQPAVSGLDFLAWGEIVAFAERDGGLTLLTADRMRRLEIPAGLDDLEGLRTELARHGVPCGEDTQRNRNRWIGGIGAVVLAVSGCGVLVGRTPGVFWVSLVAGAMVMAWLQWRTGGLFWLSQLLLWDVVALDAYRDNLHGHVPPMLRLAAWAGVVAAAISLFIQLRSRKKAAAPAP